MNAIIGRMEKDTNKPLYFLVPTISVLDANDWAKCHHFSACKVSKAQRPTVNSAFESDVGTELVPPTPTPGHSVEDVGDDYNFNCHHIYDPQTAHDRDHVEMESLSPISTLSDSPGPP